MRVLRRGGLGSVMGGLLCLLLVVAPSRRDAHPGKPLPKGTQDVISSGSNESGKLAEAPALKPTDSDGVGAAAPEATKKADAEKGADVVTTWLREHLQASLVIEYSTLLIAVVTILFAIFLAWFGYLERTRYKEVQNDLAEQRRTLDATVESFTSDVKKQREELDTKVETFKANLAMNELRLGANQRFFEAVLSHHSELLLGVIEGFRSSLKPEEDRKLRSLIFEAEAALYLFYPDKEEVLKALLLLEQIGADSSVPSLVQLRDDSATEGDIRVRAQRVLTKILDRLKEERKKSAEQPPGNGPGDRSLPTKRARRHPPAAP